MLPCKKMLLYSVRLSPFHPTSFFLLFFFLHKSFHYTVFSACLLHKLLLIFIFSFHLLIKYPISPLHVGLLTSIQPISKAAGALEAAQRSVETVNPFAYHCLGCSRHPFLPPSPPALSRPPGLMSSHCLLTIKPNYSVGFPRQPHPNLH